jgi:site-specific recombinase XerD
MRQSVIRSSQRTYKSGVSRFKAWLKSHNLHHPKNVSKCQELIGLFVTQLGTEGLQGSTAEQYVSHINYHRANKGWSKITIPDQLSMTIKGITNLQPDIPIRETLQFQQVEELCRTLPNTSFSSYKKSLFAATLCTLWDTGARPCEILWHSSTPDEYSLCNQHVTIFPSYVSIHSPWTKNNGRKGQTRFVSKPDKAPSLSPFILLHQLMVKRRQVQAAGPFLQREDGSAYTYSHFSTDLKAVAKLAGLSGKFTPGGTRAGHTTDALEAGVDPEVLRSSGAWRSHAMNIYDKSVRRQRKAALKRLKHAANNSH